jgi:hypothetical protein
VSTISTGFYGVPHCAVESFAVTIKRVPTANGTRWAMAFVEGDAVRAAVPDWAEDYVHATFINEFFARKWACAYMKKYLKQGLDVEYRGDLEG